MKRKISKKSLLLTVAVLVVLVPLLARADITVTAPQDLPDPLFTHPTPMAWHPRGENRGKKTANDCMVKAPSQQKSQAPVVADNDAQTGALPKKPQ
ncbi:hypothetical protein AB4090_14155 [Acidithiobacillus sp. IBUN Pt1247-S3]|uniref:hypothetical protein n=1 Tax=Acidithiobacillus sp. IBUN Pt1247-S3 TaxID=3166642 RepID=UPI0034E49709